MKTIIQLSMLTLGFIILNHFTELNLEIEHYILSVATLILLEINTINSKRF